MSKTVPPGRSMTAEERRFRGVIDMVLERNQALTVVVEQEEQPQLSTDGMIAKYLQDIEVVCRAMEQQFVFVKEDSIVQDSKVMFFLIEYIKYLDEFVDNDVIVWAICKHVEGALLLRRKMKKTENREMVDPGIRKLLELLPKKEHTELVQRMVTTAFTVLNRMPFAICLNLNAQSEKNRVVTRMTGFEDNMNFVECVLSVCKEEVCGVASASATFIEMLWLVCYRVLMFEQASTLAQLRATNLIISLLAARKGLAFMIIHVVDVILSYEKLLMDHEGEAPELQRNLMKCLEVIKNQLRNFSDYAWCAELHESALFEWAQRSMKIVQKQRFPSAALANFASVCLYLLQNMEEVNEEGLFAYEDLGYIAEDFFKVIFKLAKDRAYHKSVQDTVGYLIFADEKCGPSEHNKMILDLLKPIPEDKLSEATIQRLTGLGMVVQSVAALEFPSARQIAVSLFPSDEYVLWLLTECSRLVNGHDVVEPLMVIVGSCVKLEEFDRLKLTAYLSVPWLNDDHGIDWKRYAQSNKLLQSVKDIMFRSFRQNMQNAKQESLKAIAQFQYKDEWRRAIFDAAVSDHSLAKHALGYIPMLVRTINTSSALSVIQTIVKHVVQLKTDVDHPEALRCADFLSGLRSSICALEKSTEVATRVACKVCTGSEPQTKTLGLQFPATFFSLLTEAVREVNVDLSVKTEAAQFLYVMLKHNFKSSGSEFHDVLRASFSMLQVQHEDMFDAYLLCLAEIVSMKDFPESSLDDLRQVMMTLEFGPLHSAEAVCAVHSWDTVFAESCFAEHVVLSSLRRCPGMVDSSRSIVSSIAEREHIKTTQLFKRRTPVLCRELMCSLLNQLQENRAFVATTEEETHQARHVDESFAAATEIFGYDSLKVFMMDAYMQMCGYLFTSSQQFRAEAILVLERISAATGLHNADLVENAFPTIYGMIVAKQQDGVDDARAYWQNVENFVEAYTNCKVKFFIKQRLPACIDQIIYSLSICEDYCKMELWKLSTMHGHSMESYSLTEHLRDIYLGTLLKYRYVLLGDEYYAMRPVLLKSLSVMMSWLDQEFMDMTALRMIMVLRAATEIGESSVPVWHCFVKCLSPTTLCKVLPHVFIGAAPILHCASASDMLEYVRTTLNTNHLKPEELARIERLAAIMHDSDKVQVNEYLPGNVGQLEFSKLLSYCVQCLLEEGAEVAELVLTKLMKVLTSDPIDDAISAKLIEALLHTLRTNPNSHVHRMVCQCLGRLGAVDPGKIADCMTRWKEQNNKMHFELDNQFYANLLTNCAKLHLECTDAKFVDCISFAVQQVLYELKKSKKGMIQEIEKLMTTEHVEAITPLMTTSFRMSNLPNPSLIRPVVNEPIVNAYPEWVSQWYAICARNVMDDHLNALYMSLRYIVSTGAADVHFGLFAICHVMIQLLVEGSATVLKDCLLEMTTVLTLAHEKGGWLQKAAHVVFAVIDTAELYLSYRAELLTKCGQAISTDKEYSCVANFIRSVMDVRVGDDSLAVLVAQSCHCPTRALKWLEQYCIEKDQLGVWNCSRGYFFRLEKIYADLDNTDAVLGAFQSIDKKWRTSDEEAIVAFEATGNYNEALSLYNSKDLSVQLIKSLIRLNKPDVAWNSSAKLSVKNDVDTLRAYQIEAAWKLSKWSELDELVEAAEKKNNTAKTWGSMAASIFDAVRSADSKKFETRIERAREHLVTSMTAMTMDKSDTYSKCYKYVSQLSILTELEEAVDSLELLKSQKDYTLGERTLNKVLDGWKRRSDNALNVDSIQEPMLTVRRSILEHANASPKLCKNAIGGLLLQSSRLARQAGHHQVSWTFLVEAKRTGICGIDFAVEESRYLFDKGEVSRAVNILENAIRRTMPTEVDAFEECTRVSSKRWTDVIAGRQISPENLNTFLKTKLLLCDYMQRGGESSLDDLYVTYVFISKFSENSEDLCYRVAVFLDNYVYTKNEVLNPQQIVEVLKSYASVLTKGKNHLFHAMPRILTVWLDSGLEITSQRDPRTGRSAQTYVDVAMYNQVIVQLFNSGNHFMFYTAFAQLISRITHPNDAIYQVLKEILATLVAEYPHQCLWKCASLMRSEKNREGHKRCMEVLELAKRKAPSIERIIDQYNYIAKEFLKACNQELPKNQKRGTFKSSFPQIPRFFTDGTMHDERSVNQKRGKPKILLPFSEYLEKEFETPVHTLTQAQPESEEPEFDGFSESVYIDSVCDEFIVMSSIAQPKRCVLRGSDGKLYPILLKPKDELRKDSRVMDFARMVNALLMQNSEARRKHLSIKTYTVVPLQEQSGLIEWVPDLMTFRSTITPLMNTKLMRMGLPTNVNDKRLKILNDNIPDDDRLKTFLKIYENCPVVMSEWFRSHFTTPSQWYAARTAFTTSTAVMSMVGFVLGLGDRHPDNFLLNVKTGEIVHVDYNMLFNKAEELRVPEIVPFRLTRNVVDGFGPTGVEGVYRKSCETTMSVLRQKKDMLLTVLATFLHDPLMEWGTQRSQQHKQNKAQAANSVPVALANEVTNMVEDRLSGKIVSPKIFTSMLTNAPMSVQGQVAKLIDISTDDRRLAKMYIGWGPHL